MINHVYKNDRVICALNVSPWWGHMFIQILLLSSERVFLTKFHYFISDFCLPQDCKNVEHFFNNHYLLSMFKHYTILQFKDRDMPLRTSFFKNFGENWSRYNRIVLSDPWGVFCECEVRSMLCCCHCIAAFDIMLYCMALKWLTNVRD